MTRAARVYITALGALAVGLMVHSALAWEPGLWGPFAFLALVGIAGNLYTYRSDGPHHMSFLGPAVVVALLTCGTAVAISVAALGELAKAAVRRFGWAPAIYNTSQYVVTTWATAGLFELIGGAPAWPFDSPVRGLLAAIAFMLINWALLSFLLFLLQGTSFLSLYARHLLSSSTYTYFILQTMAVLAAGYGYQRLDWLVPLMALIALLYGAFHQHFRALREAQSKGEQLAAVLDATESAMAAIDGDGRILLANRRFGELFHLGARDPAGCTLTDLLPPEVRALALAGDGSGAAANRRPVEWNGLYLDWFRAPVGTDGATLLHVFTDVTAAMEHEKSLRRAHDAVIGALVAAIDARDPYTRGHSQRVSDFATAVAGELGLPEPEVRRIRYAALLHDVGKVGVDDQVLRKEGPLTPGERAMMMQHPLIGAEMLKKAEVLRDLLPGIRWHHEWLNGGGYPDGLTEGQIPLDARIIGVADAFDAMTSDRPYRAALAAAEALRRLEAGRGEQFDAEIVAALVRLYAAGRIETAAAAAGRGSQPGPEQKLGQIRPVHGRELRILYQLAQEEVDHRDLEGTLERFFELFSQHVGDYMYSVFIFRPGGEPMLAFAHGDAAPHADLARVAARVQAANETQITHLDDIEGNPCFVLALPLRSRGELVGALSVQARERGAFHDEAVYLLEALTQPVASAISLAVYHDMLTQAATHDALTGLLNRAAFYERLGGALVSERQFALAILDMDGFKGLNDHYGHLAGDTLLSSFGAGLGSICRPGDAVGRLGGDEFAILMPGIDRETAGALAARARDLLAGLQVPGVEPWDLPGVSIGIAVYPDDAVNARDLVVTADQAMYCNKSVRRRPGSPDRLVRATGRA